MARPGRRALLFMAAAGFIGACRTPDPSGAAQPPREVVVFAASSLSGPFDEIGRAFGASSGASVTINYAATTQLRSQLEQGARADLFAAASVEQMDAAARSGLVVGERPIFARNRLVVIVPAGDPGRVGRLEDLARPGLRLVITQRDVPVGVYTRDVLGKMARDPRFGPDFAGRVLANVRSEEANVRQVVARVQLGEADAAFVYATDVAAAEPNLARLEIPDALNVIAEYPIGIVKDAREPSLADAFIRYLLGEKGRDALARHGFVVPAA